MTILIANEMQEGNSGRFGWLAIALRRILSSAQPDSTMARIGSLSLAALLPAATQSGPRAEQPPTVTHNNTRPAGRLENGTLSIALRAGVGRRDDHRAAESPSRSVNAANLGSSRTGSNGGMPT